MMTKQNPDSRASRIRALLAEGKTPIQIAAQLGCTKQAVYLTRYSEKKKAAKLAKRKPGRPKGSKSKPKQVTQQDIEQAKKRAEELRLQYNPHPGTMQFLNTAPPYGFMDRIRILFTGRA
jgi:transposase